MRNPECWVQSDHRIGCYLVFLVSSGMLPATKHHVTISSASIQLSDKDCNILFLLNVLSNVFSTLPIASRANTTSHSRQINLKV